MKDDLKHFIDFGAVGTAIGALIDFLPHVASLLSIIWLVLRAYGMWLDIEIKRKDLGK